MKDGTTFKERHYCIIRNTLSEELLSFLTEYYCNKAEVYKTKLRYNFVNRYDESEGTLNEARVIASATIYGNKGVVADGNGCLAYLISHNFAYVGTGKNVENETDIINQENQVVTTNNAKVHFVSQDQDGDFRVGENIIVDLGKGTTSIDVTG